MSKYSEADFREAQFARTEDGLVAMRAFPDGYEPWIFVTRKGTTALRTDSSMPREDWVPVTGRTITESEAKPLRGIMVRRDGRPALKIEDYLGLTVVPDPEPTNAEKLEKIIWASGGPVASISLTRAELLAKWLDEAGVKAPGGDDE